MKDGLYKAYQIRGDGGEMRVGPIIGYASTRARAEEMAYKKGFFGNGTITDTWVVCIGKDVYALASPTPIDLNGEQAISDARLRRETLAKLTPEEQRVLGIK
jgi:hypothetical protein